MTDDLPLSPLDADDALAAEYVLGVLSLPDRSAVEARLKNDSAFVARVAAWENRLSPLNDDYAEVAAPDLMPRIEARLFPVADNPARRPPVRALASTKIIPIPGTITIPVRRIK